MANNIIHSFNFPNMLGSNSTNIITDKEAIKSNLRLLLASERTSLFGDPYFGTALKQTIFEQSNSLIVDLLIDEIYTSILTFMPHIYVGRNDITIWCDHTDIFAEIQCTYKLDNTSDLYIINLTSSEGSE